jgi:hypothetical protein
MAEAKGITPPITPEEVTEGFDDKRGWRRIMALWGSTNSPFYR